MDESGHFLSIKADDDDAHNATSAAAAASIREALKSMWRRLFRNKTSTFNVHGLVLTDLQSVAEVTKIEIDNYFAKKPPISAREQGKRMMYLFQQDLLPGITGKILESKRNRDDVKERTVSLRLKLAGYAGVFIVNAGMMFYIFLFALMQTASRQSAWFQSFLLWIVVEILFVSSVMVFITHIFMPMLIMKDVSKI